MFRVLSDSQINELYLAALNSLWDTGVSVRHAEARDLLAEAGARVERERVYIPARLVEEALTLTPKTFTLWGRDGNHRLLIQPDRVYFGPGLTCTYFIDPETGERRLTRRGDPGLTALVCDALDNIDYVMALGLISDVTPSLAPVYEFAEMITHTSKPVLAWAYSADQVSDIYQMALAVAGTRENLRQRPFLAVFATFQAPGQHTQEDLDKCFWAIEHDIPIVYLGAGSAGATAPVTGAGVLIQYLMGILSGLVIIQLKRRGAWVILGGVPSVMDLLTARFAYGSPEMSLYSAAMADIHRALGVPFMGTAGASESKVLDAQAAIECTFQVLASCLSGATLVHDVGFLDCADIGSLESLVMNDEIIAMARRFMRGITVNDETMMLDVIHRVGPDGHYLAEPETAAYCRQEIWVPRLMDRQPYQDWKAAGALTMEQRIRRRLKEILATHKPRPLPEGATAVFERILRTAEERAKA